VKSEDPVLRRIRRRSIGIGAALAIGAFAGFGWRSGVTLTICSAVVIFSFLVFERLTERFGNPVLPRSSRTVIPLLLVTAVAVILLIGIFGWNAFEPVAGVIGLSTVVLAIVVEAFRREEGPAA
jgi:hypothetical protein